MCGHNILTSGNGILMHDQDLVRCGDEIIKSGHDLLRCGQGFIISFPCLTKSWPHIIFINCIFSNCYVMVYSSYSASSWFIFFVVPQFLRYRHFQLWNVRMSFFLTAMKVVQFHLFVYAMLIQY